MQDGRDGLDPHPHSFAAFSCCFSHRVSSDGPSVTRRPFFTVNVRSSCVRAMYASLLASLSLSLARPCGAREMASCSRTVITPWLLFVVVFCSLFVLWLLS